MENEEYVSEEEWDNLTESLSDYHSIFSKFWGMGQPKFTRAIPTAGVSFDTAGQAVSWQINPDFWKTLSEQGKVFAIAHECMHIIFSHGVRASQLMKGASKQDIVTLNAAMDVSINDHLEKHYGFNRVEVEPKDVRYCWLDELLPGEPSGKNFEYYYEKLLAKNPKVEAKVDSQKRKSDEKSAQNNSKSKEKSDDDNKVNDEQSDGDNGANLDGDDGDGDSPGKRDGSENNGSGTRPNVNQPKAGNENKKDSGVSASGRPEAKFDNTKGVEKPKNASTVDSHEGLSSFEDEGVSKMLDRTTDQGTKEELVQIASQDATNAMKQAAAVKQQGILPGASPGNTFLEFASIRRLKPKPKWETIIKRWARKSLSDESTEMSWVNENRRIDSSILAGLNLPAEGEGENFERNKIRVSFFLDTSGSCIHLAERFFRAAKTLDPRRFDVRLYCFDTRVYKTTLKEARVYGGGGTAFDIIETAIQQEMKEKDERYPDAVFMITDCYGNRVEPEKPKNWHIFVTEGGDITGWNCFPPGVNYYSLKDFE